MTRALLLVALLSVALFAQAAPGPGSGGPKVDLGLGAGPDTPGDGAPGLAALPRADDLTLEVPEQAVLLGSWFDVVVWGPLDAAAEVTLQVVDADGDALESDALLVEPRVGRSVEPDRLVLTLRVCAVREGEHAVGGLVVSEGRPRALPPVRLAVVSGLDPDRVPRVAERLGPVEPPLPAAPAGVTAAVLLAALAALGLLIVRHTREREVVVHQPPADLLAIEALERLRSALPRTAEETMIFVVQVSGVLRTYIEARFELHAPARTTEEFLAEAAALEDGDALRSEALREFMLATDLVKFARARPGETELLGMLDTAARFVEETRW